MSTATIKGLDLAFGADAAAAAKYGPVVQRAAATLPAATTPTPIFQVIGGRVIISLIVGQVTTIIQNQATTLKLQANPTVGTTLDISGTVDLNNAAVGTLIGFTGALAGTPTAGLAVVGQTTPWVVDVGTIDQYMGATSSGALKFTARWVPLDEGATLVAA